MNICGKGKVVVSNQLSWFDVSESVFPGLREYTLLILMYRHSLTVHFFYKLIYVTVIKIQSVQKPIQVPYSPVKYSEISIILMNRRPR